MRKSGRSLLWGSVAACAVAASVPAAARTNFDGAWSVLIVTERGSCDRAYRYPIKIAAGRVTYGGEGSFTVSGRVAPSGAVKVSIRRGEQAANGNGRLGASSGAGTWKSDKCGGIWSAERR